MFTHPVLLRRRIALGVGALLAVGALSAQADDVSGEKVFNQVCTACHTSGVLQAPKVDDKAAWASRISEQGKPLLYKRAIEGYNNMPPKGGNSTLSNAEVKAAVDYMIETSGAG
ncbi:c-type cytochrome [Salinisphaera sp. T31B1]|uniref:c-type cytochrome n=1 Tax=Salinisphaera sp. T31B1 TaxID=727963 RepID=UPI0033428E03